MEAEGVIVGTEGVALECVSRTCEKTSATVTGSTWKRGDKTHFRCQDCSKTSKCLILTLKCADQDTVDDWAAVAPEDKARFKEQMVGVKLDGWAKQLKTFLAEAQSIVWEIRSRNQNL